MGKFADTSDALHRTRGGCRISQLAEDEADLDVIRRSMSDPELGATSIARWLGNGITERLVRYHRERQCESCCRRG